jgi:sigma-B regulation protein RsbU (phosphoserine phosphatase)
MAYCNAGHNPPFVIRADGAVERLKGGGTVLGILPELGYEERKSHVESGDVVVLYSDGVTEATNPQEEEFGEERLEDLLKKHRTDPVHVIVEKVNEAVAVWCAGAPPADDVTLVVARRN